MESHFPILISNIDSLQAAFKPISVKLSIPVAVLLKQGFSDREHRMAQRLWN